MAHPSFFSDHRTHATYFFKALRWWLFFGGFAAERILLSFVKKRIMMCDAHNQEEYYGGGPKTQEQVQDLRERMRLLQGDRRANVEMLETNKVANKAEIKRLREEVKELRRRLGKLCVTQNDDGPQPDWSVARMRKAYDAQKEKRFAKRRAVEKLEDEVRDLALAKRSSATSPTTDRSTRMLENRLDKALIKYNEALSIKKTYEQIVERLREERVGFDHQLTSLERTFTAKRRDYEELLLLSGDATHARELAFSELERVRRGYDEERRRREKELQERHQMLQLRKQTIDRVQKRDKLRRDLIDYRGDDDDDPAAVSGREEPQQLLTMNNRTSSSQALVVSKERLEQRTKIDVFERAFRKIKDATGVSDVNEVIQKIVSQETTTQNLTSLTKEHQQRIQVLQEQKRRLEAHLEDVKYSSAPGGSSRKTVDDKEEHLSAATARLDRARAKYERLAKTLVAAKAGVKHLQDKLDCLRSDVQGPSESENHLDVTDDTLVRAMTDNETIAAQLLARLEAGNDLGLNNDQSHVLTGGDQQQEASLYTRPYNQRIELPAIDDLNDDGVLGPKEDLFSGDLDEELTREKVKRASSQILLAQDKLKRKHNKSHRKDNKQSQRGATAAAAAPSGENRPPAE